MSITNYGKSPKIKKSKVEQDIDRCRAECRWFRARDLLTQLKTERLTISTAFLTSLVLAEFKLEKILNEKDNITLEEAREIKVLLDEVINGSDDGYKLEAKIMLAKLRFQQEKYKEALTSLEGLNLKNVWIEQGHSRLTKLVAEGFAVVGLSLEQMEGDNTNKDAISKIVENLDLAGDVGLFHLQELEKAVRHSPQVDNSGQDELEGSAVVTKVLSKAIQRSPIISIKNDQLGVAVERYRQLLRCCETETSKPLRQTLSRQLAEVLLRGVCQANYARVSVASLQHQESATGPSAGMLPSPAAMWRSPAKYAASITASASGSSPYCPTDLNQEAILLLLISEYLASQEAVLNRSSEHMDARLSTLYNSQAVYDLLAIALSRLHCYPYLCRVLQHALRFSYQEWHTWHQLGLALVSARQLRAGYLVLGECLRLEPPASGVGSGSVVGGGLARAGVLLLVATLAAESGPAVSAGPHDTGHLEEALCRAREAAQVYSNAANKILSARCHLVAARALSQLCLQARLAPERARLHSQAAEELHFATSQDPADPAARYHLGMLLADSRQLRPALECAATAVRLAGTSEPGPLHLLALLHSATSRVPEALRVVEAALLDHPHDLGLLRTLARLQLAAGGGPGSDQGRRAALRAYRRVVEASRELECRGSASLASVMAPVEGSHAGSATTTAGPSPAVPAAVPGGTYSTEALLGLAELYLDCEMPQEASRCVESLRQRSSSGGGSCQSQLLYLRGRLAVELDVGCKLSPYRLKDARLLYESSLALQPGHVCALQRLGNVLHQLRQFQLAEKTLRDALQIEPNNSRSWQLLGELFTELCCLSVGDGWPISITAACSTSIYDVSSDISAPVERQRDDDDDPDTLELLFGSAGLADPTNVSSRKEMVAYATKCLAVAADLELTEPILPFNVLPRAIKNF